MAQNLQMAYSDSTLKRLFRAETGRECLEDVEKPGKTMKNMNIH